MTFLHIDLACKRSFCEFLMNFGWISTGIHNKTCKISKNPYFQLNYKRRQSKGATIPKDFGRFFSRISCSKRSLAVCTTVVQLGILRSMLKEEYIRKLIFVDIESFLRILYS